MEFTNAAAWLQAPQITDLHDERSSATADDWKDQNASVQGGINDLLTDIPVTNPPSTSANSPGTTFFIPQFYLAATANPFNAVQYGAGSWPSTSAQQLPLSSYSSLNGATSTSSHSQTQTQQSNSMVIDPALTTMNGSASSPPPQYQQPSFIPQQPQTRIQYPYQQSHQPALSINPSFVHNNTSHFQQSQQHPISLPRHHSHSPAQPQQQGTLSPFVLHSPTSAFYANISPSSFYGHPGQAQAGPSTPQPPTPQPVQQPSAPAPVPVPQPSKPSAEQKKAQLARDVKPLIQPNSFTGAGAVSQLVEILDDYGIAEVEAPTRLEILTKIRDNAGNHYFRAWVDNTIAMDIVREWLKLAFTGRNDSQLVETIMPILHIIDRLPLSIEKLKLSKLGRLIMKLMKEPPSPAIKDMASNLERKWRKMLNDEVSEKMDTENGEDAKGKKRRAESAPAKGAPPAKKAAVPSATTTTPKAVPVKKETKPVVKDAKSDSSFFSKPKPTKKEMPSFKKNPPAVAAPVKKEPADSGIAQPSSFNPFEEVLKSYKSVPGPSATTSTSTPPPGAVGGPPAALPTSNASLSTSGSAGLNKMGKPRKSVTWAPDGKLELIKFIERAVYDDDPATGSHPTHNIRDLDRDEGAALHAHLFDEQIEWAEPQPLEMPPDLQIPPRGGESTERAAQEEREQSALVVLYSSPAQIPDSPAEPPTQIPEEQVDEGVCIMLTGPEVDAVFWQGGAPAIVDTVRPSASVAELVGQLAAAPPDVVMGDASQAQAAMPNLYGNLNGINVEQLQQLMQHAQALSQGPFAGAPSSQAQHGEPSQGWGPGNQYSEYDRGYHENVNGAGAGRGGGPGEPNRRWNEDAQGWGPDRGGRGRGGGRGMRGGGRGRGDGYRSTKRKPCSFFQAGRCRYGDQCDFSHEILPY
ncbi:hypothetical protein L226DRAFT_535485 [Lentinus tigrinus ALCF2SS1-7]|uniref:Serine/threonine-protein phosphatase 1 regulatory subunit 10 n=1 Tax=Lentinus tigrinus ALCF2SS1-6 TaxID=1328759 RepID=A0A5C2SED7_9APHY|nr:hypothetical protein L227DRAFT_573979 [Lentinus tigrinus ALCF2SS1-6]RPD74610.1 hypothetical protein L226DRAFT_535485 [Lentinus tigrinus ALCF2SS1-7]